MNSLIIGYHIHDIKWLHKRKKLEQICGTRVDDISRNAKYIIWMFSNMFSDTKVDRKAFYAINHLAMTGSWLFRATQKIPLHARLTLLFQKAPNEKEIILDFVDTRKWGKLDFYTADEFHIDKKVQNKLGTLGPDTLNTKIKMEYVTDYFSKLKKKKSKVEIKPLLMFQPFLSGIGNIYASEICWLAGIDPTKKVIEFTELECNSLVEAIQPVMKRAYENGGSSIRDFIKPNGSKGLAQNFHMIYGLKTCRMCSTNIEKINQQNRTTYRCPKCQK